MSTSQISITLGTAGHIDHGKTALVKSLTGCETDRLREEKERGMSIDLGYAPCTLVDCEVGIVDVPGHENFVRTMVAGASGMDAVILVVAADDGIMPQTCEHLEILTLLGVRHGLVALTKVDRVTFARQDEVRASLAHFLRGTFLESAPVLGVSNVTGEGFDAFYEALLALVKSIPPRSSAGVFRVPLDRGFTSPGHGTVVAGIPIAGQAQIGDEVVLLPQGLRGQIRRIEVYGRTSDAVRAGQCAAMNIGQWEHDAIHRGQVVALPGYFSPLLWYLCELRMLKREKVALRSGAHVKFHTGTTDVAASIYPLKGEQIESGETVLVQIRTQHPIVAGPGDPFIVRTPSPVRTVGGGVIVEGLPRRLKAQQPAIYGELVLRAAAATNSESFLEHCLRYADSPATTLTELGQRAKVLPAQVQTAATHWIAAGTAIDLGGRRLIHRQALAETGEKFLAILGQFHQKRPESPGMTREELRAAIGLEPHTAEAIIGWLKREHRVVETNQRLARADHQTTFAPKDSAALQALEELFRRSAMNPPSADEAATTLHIARPEVDRLLRLLREHGRLIAVEGQLFFHVDAVAKARQILVDYLRREKQLESVKFKYLLDTTRKFAIPLLDYFDRVGVTGRSGHTRFLKPGVK